VSLGTPTDALANVQSVLSQAAAYQQSVQTAKASSPTAPGGPTNAPPSVPTLGEVLAKSDAAAQKALSAYAKAPAGSLILDYQG
jgi:hypothetical protein